MGSTNVQIADIYPYTQSVASGGQTVFDTTWTANFASDVVVYQTPVGQAPDDATQILSYPSAYSVSFVGASQIVRVTLVTGASLGDVITITRQTPASRMNLYTNTNFTPTMLNEDFGILTLVDQQAQLVNQQRAPRYNYSQIISLPNDIILPILTANQFWAKDPTNTFIQALDINEIISGGTVTQVNTGLGLTGGPITDAGTISFAAMPANTFWGNITSGTAVPTQVTTGYFLKSANNLSDLTNVPQAQINIGLQIGVNVQAYSAKLTSLAGLSFVQNDLLYIASSSTLGLIAAANNSTLITGNTGVPSLSQTLPQAVQTNIQYLGVQNQNLNMGGFQINNGADPTSPTDFATKNYVDLNSLTGTAVYAASTGSLGTVTQSGSGVGATLTNAGVQATFALDGVNPPVNSKVLIKDTSTGMTAANEGIYTVTNVGSGASNWVLTRATTYDTPSEINNTGLIIIQNGTTLAGTAWYNAVTIVTVDVTSFNFSEFGNITFPVSLAHGGTNNNITASAGGILWSDSTKMNMLAGTSTANQVLLSGSSATPAWSTATYPATTTINQLLYSSADNTIVGLSTVNSAGLLTNGSGVPGWVAYTGTGAPVLNTSPKIITSILDTNGNAIIGISATASAVNNIQISNSATGGACGIQAVGSDSNIKLNLTGKGTGGVEIQGSSSGVDNGAGYLGETITSTITDASATSYTSGTTVNLTSVNLTAGKWLVTGNVAVAGTTVITLQGGINSTSGTLPAFEQRCFNGPTGVAACSLTVPDQIVNIGGTTPYYMVINASGTGTMNMSGNIRAVRIQ